MTTIWTVRICGFLLLVPFFVPSAFAQSAQSSVSGTLSAPESDKPPEERITVIGNDELKALEPSRTERMLRSWQYQFQLLEQPAVLVATSGGTTATIPNPNKWLQQHSITLTLSELFPRTSNLALMVQTAYDSHYPNFDPKNPVRPKIMLGEDICPPKTSTPLECLAGGVGFSHFLERLFSGAKLQFYVSQRDEVQQQIVVPTLSAAEGWS